MRFSNRKPQRVYVLGAGPAGLLAAHAAESKGYETIVLTAPNEIGKPAKSELHGCQYLHEPIPDLTQRGERRWVKYRLEGTSEDYRRKVYGDSWAGHTSVDEFGPEEDHPAWDLRAVYDRLWEQWHSLIVPTMLSSASGLELRQDKQAVVVSTVPAPVMCLRPEDHKFPTASIYAIGENVLGRADMPFQPDDETVVCNGNAWNGWYRAARVFGRTTIEWPERTKPPFAGVVAVKKPLSTDCDCHGWLRAGRYGRWQKGVLVHTAYEDTMEALP